MSASSPIAKRFDGYRRSLSGQPDLSLCEVGRGTPSGEYLRRYWHPVARLDELGKVPLRVRALGENLVAFRDGRGEVGVLQLQCCHRNTSLEFGIVSERGIRCCYHGRLYDVDGTVLEMPGEFAVDRLAEESRQGAYPTHVFGGLVFVYMGPPERIPLFPAYDRFDLPGVKLVPGTRWPLKCNWLQVQENALDAAHTATLHAIPQLRGRDHFATEFGNFPTLSWAETPGGFVYLAARHVDDNVWVRSAETLGPTLRCISSIFETGKERKPASYPFLSLWSLPVDDGESITFYISHVCEDEAMPFEKRRALEDFGQREDRSYYDRQYIPGDHEAMVGQGSVNIHANEHLGTLDRGIVMFRRYVRKGIVDVENGQDPHSVYHSEGDLPPTFANDCVVPASEMEGDPDDPRVLRAFCKRLLERYRAQPPMMYLK